MTYPRPRARSNLLRLFLGLLLICTVEYVVISKQLLTSSKPLLVSSTAMAYGANVDMTAMIPGTGYTVRTANGGTFFDLAAQLGINTLRITDIRWETTGKEYSQTIWQHVFDEAEHYHLKVILLLENGGESSAIQQAHKLLGYYNLARAPALWMVDLYNEPDLNDAKLMTIIQQEARYVHQIAPRVHITIGGWKSELAEQPGKFLWESPADIPSFINLVDVVSPHLYEYENGARLGLTPQQWTGNFLNAIRRKASNKPILLEEFGASNGLAPTNQPTATGSFEWQASVYKGVQQEVLAECNQGVIGAVAWIIAPRPAWPNPGPYNYERDMTGWAFVLDHGRRLLPASKELSAIACTKQ